MISPLMAETFQLVKIVYLTPDALDEDVLLTMLDFKEGDYYSQEELEHAMSLSRARLRYWNVFNEVSISVKDSTKVENGKVVFIKLFNGFDSLYDGGIYYFTYGKRNHRRRGDFWSYTVGINKLIYEYKLHLKNPNWRFDQRIGYSFSLDEPFFPYYPLNEEDSIYIQEAGTEIAITRILTPDLSLSLYTNPELRFLNYHYPDTFDWEMERTSISLGLKIALDRNYLMMLYPLAFSVESSYDWNFDLEGKNSYGEFKCSGILNVKPVDFLILKMSPHFNSMVGNQSIYEEYNLNIGDFFRGNIENSPYSGNLAFFTNFDLQYRFAEFSGGGSANSMGATLLYDLTAIGDDSFDNGFEHTLGGGLWYYIGIPVGIQIYGNYGYTIGESWALNFGVTTSY